MPRKLCNVLRMKRHAIDLISHAYMPSNIETALDCEEIKHVEDSLSAIAHCRVCMLLHGLLQRNDPPDSFFEDYSLLCFYVQRSPKCWTSVFLTALDLAYILEAYFEEYGLREKVIYGINALLGSDIFLHFYVLKCFVPVKSTEVQQFEDLNALKLGFLQCTFKGLQCNKIPFKSVWKTLSSNDSLEKFQSDASSSGKHVIHPLRETQDIPDSFLPIFVSIWKDSVLFKQPFPVVDNAGIYPPDHPLAGDGDVINKYSGPCLMAPTFTSTQKNGTCSVCVICECLAASKEAKGAIDLMRDEIMSCFGNNVKLIDRIAFILSKVDALSYISDPLLRQVLLQCRPQEIHKHLFCDPICITNAARVDVDVLFGSCDMKDLSVFKSALAYGLQLRQEHIVPAEELDTLLTIFKSIQLVGVNKTTFNEILATLGQLLHQWDIKLINLYNTAQLYV